MVERDGLRVERPAGAARERGRQKVEYEVSSSFCSRCGGPLQSRVPEGDDRPRAVCDQCGRIHYVNPKVVVGCVAEWNNRVLLCRRAIEPRLGLWTVPAGYLEVGETVAAGTRRETYEEARARLTELTPYALFNLTFVGQIYFMFRAGIVDGRFGRGMESSEVELFEEGEIPWDSLAFSVVRETLRRYFEDRASGQFPFRMGDIWPDRPSPER